MLTRYVKACCPQQAIDEYTADAWHDLLEDVTFDEAKQAVIAVARRQPFVAPAEIISEVRFTRSVHGPHSQACRSKDCRECVWSWCACVCHNHAALPPPATPRGILAINKLASRLAGEDR